MLNAVYRLVAPRRFEVAFNNIDLCEDKILVRPTHMSICRADQRYYQGTRPAEILEKKLPMALIHEAVGEVVYDPQGYFAPGNPVVLIPNLPSEYDDIISENYLESSVFRSSGYDGFMQDYISMDKDRVIKLPDSINKSVASFTELSSVSVHAIGRFSSIAHMRRNNVGIWGDGTLGYITAVIFKALFPDTELYIFGTDREKLESFSFAERTFLVQSVPENIRVDHAFECVGGDASQKAVNQIISLIRPEGTIALLGVSEYNVPLNTRLILEKGLRLFGSSRSGRKDFEKIVELYKSSPEIIGHLVNIVGAQIEIRSINDMVTAFETDMRKPMGKTIMIWKK